MPLEKVERNFVADAHNWEQRVRGEMESARVSIIVYQKISFIFVT